LTIAAVIVAIVEPFACQGERSAASAVSPRFAAGTIIERILVEGVAGHAGHT
jgi:hypothetical protein